MPKKAPKGKKAKTTPGASSSQAPPPPADPRPAATPTMLPPVRGPTDHSYDESRFVSREAALYYDRQVERKALIKERGLRITHAQEESFRQICEARQWLEFIELPKKANLGMVREFYSNLTDTPTGSIVRVRGQDIDFSPAAINALFHLPDLSDEEHALLQEGDHGYTITEVTALIATPDAQWVMKRNGRYRHLLVTHLTHEARVWFQFVISRIIPSSHISDCTLDRALLIYSILTGRPIDLGRLIHSMMRATARYIQWGLWFMDIITRLCQQAGVLRAMDDLFFRPGTIITGVPSPPVAPVPPAGFLHPPPAPAPADQFQQILDRFQHMDDRFQHMNDQVQQLEHDHSRIHQGQRLHALHIDQWFRALANHVPEMDPSTFPQIPPFFGDPDDPGDASPPASPGASPAAAPDGSDAE